jgi:mRNA-degrading endonuclease toxin of MazEF toxin-antitoxin module
MVKRFEVYWVDLNPKRGREIRSVDRSRLVRRLGETGPSTCSQVLAVLQEMFAE